MLEALETIGFLEVRISSTKLTNKPPYSFTFALLKSKG
jgi:hypothetical protein